MWTVLEFGTAPNVVPFGVPCSTLSIKGEPALLFLLSDLFVFVPVKYLWLRCLDRWLLYNLPLSILLIHSEKLLIRVLLEEVVSQRQEGTVSVGADRGADIRFHVASYYLPYRRSYFDKIYDELIFRFDGLFELEVLKLPLDWRYRHLLLGNVSRSGIVDTPVISERWEAAFLLDGVMNVLFMLSFNFLFSLNVKIHLSFR